VRKNNQSIGSNAVLALLVAVAALGCAGQQQRGVATDPPGTTERNKGVVREFYRVFSTGNVADVLALMRDDATYWVSGSVQGFSGMKTKAQLAEVLAGVGKLYVGGSLPLAPTTVIAEGELVFAEASGRAELQNGRVYEPHSAWVFRIEDGLIVEIREFIDTKHSYEVFLAP
jgi:ketosteroid isomerase-like protein